MADKSNDKIIDDKPEKPIEFPPLDFTYLITEYSTTAMAYLGGMQNPETNKPLIDLPLAKRMIDTINLLGEKTKGNLTAPESNYLENTLYSLKMTYVQIVKDQETKSSSSEDE